jgi:putative ATP-binding cassette transporter
MGLIKFLLRISWARVVFSIALGIVSGACSTGLLALINTKLNSNRISPSTLLLAFVGLCLVVPFARFTAESLLIGLGQGAVFNLRMQMCRRILAAPMRGLEEIGAHRLIATLTDDIPAITAALTYIPLFCINIVVVVGCLVYLGFLSVPALLAVLFFMVLGVISYQLPTAKAMFFHRLGREHADRLYHHFRALTTGTKELKLHSSRREAFLQTLLEPTAATLKKLNYTGQLIFLAASCWGQVLLFIVIGVMVFALPSVSNVNNEILTGCALALVYLMTPLEVILNVFPNMARAGIALQKVERLGLSLEAQAERSQPTSIADSQASWETMELSGVTHTYHREKENSQFTLGPIDLTFLRGETVFLTGGNGCGKTTLIKLIIGLYEPESGEIRLDGKPITNENREQYRQLFSAVFSDFFLFESLLGVETRELDKRALEYLVQLQLDHKVQVKNGELSTIDLSQGQRKRLALLTAYLEDRPIYVFDEWAADQDPQFKEIFYLQLLPELKAKGKTVLVISHDDRYYDLADRIVKMDYGQVIQDRYSTLFTPTCSTLSLCEQINEPVEVAV